MTHPTRRTVLRRACPLAAAGFLPRQVEAGRFTGKIRKAVKFHMVQEDLSVADKFKLLLDLGFDGTEIRTRDPVKPAEVRKAVDHTGLPVHGVVHSSSPDIDVAIRQSKDYGGTSVLVVARYDRKISLQENWDRDLARYRKAAEVAEKEKIHVLLENVWASYLISAFDYRSMIDAVGNPWFGSYFDVGNNMRWGVPNHWIPFLGERIGKLDIKEYSTKKQVAEGLRAGFSVELGEGSIQWDAVREQLARIDFSGWATAEVKGGGRERLADIARRMSTVLDLA